MGVIASPGGTSDASDDEYEDAATHVSKRQRLKQLTEKTKEVPKRLAKHLDILDISDHGMDVEGKEIEGITDNPIFNTGDVFHKPRKSSGNIASRAAQSIQSAAHHVAHPRTAVKKRATQLVPPVERQYSTLEEDEKLLDAHHLLKKSRKSSVHTSGSASESNVKQKIERVKELEESREQMRTAWITSKHVKRARVVPRGQIKIPNAEDYRETSAQGNYVKFRWEKYIGHYLLYLSEDFAAQYVDDTNALSFKRGTVLHYAERFFIATSPWQTYLMHVRRVYMWEDRYLTGRWFLIFLFLLKTGYIVTFAYCYIAYIVIRNGVFPMSPDALKESHERAVDRGRRVHSISELIKRHGQDQWLDPLLDELGPLIQQQLGDLADYLEILINFYNWRDPKATLCTIMFWLACAMVSACTSAEFGQKLVFWSIGLYFFWSRPIASRYPKYRHIVSIFRWIYWDIPTHGELAFRKLRRQAQSTREDIIEQHVGDKATAEDFELDAKNQPRKKSIPRFEFPNGDDLPAVGEVEKQEFSSDSSSDSSDDMDEDGNDATDSADFHILSFHGRWRKQVGRLSIHATGIKFDCKPSHAGLLAQQRHDSPNGEELWSRSYQEMVELSKSHTTLSTQNAIARKIGKKLLHGEALKFTWTDGTEDSVEGMRRRDEAFNTIIGFSGVQWQILPAVHEDGDMIFHDGDERHQDGEYPKGKGRMKRQKSGKVLDELGKIG